MRLHLIVVAGAACAIALTGCNKAAKPIAAPSPSPSSSTVEGAGGAGVANPGTGSTGNSGQSNPKGTTTTKPAGPNGPGITYFRIKQAPSCPAGTNKAPIAGRDLTVEWSVAGAESVTLSVDGPGVFNSYGAQGVETFAFGCDGKPGDTAKHTYLLIAKDANGKTTQKTLTATAKVNEISTV
jgi:hypothetical protein